MHRKNEEVEIVEIALDDLRAVGGGYKVCTASDPYGERNTGYWQPVLHYSTDFGDGGGGGGW